MTREELLRHARAMYEFSQTPESVKSALEKEFPELHESEDERIVSVIKNIIEGVKRGSTLKITAIDANDCTAYLERQKEPHYSPLCKTIKDKIREYIANHFVADTVVKTDMKSIVKAMEEGVRLGMEEQKPVEKSSMLKILKEHLANTPREQLDAEFEALKDLTIDKPAEWSEEEKERIRQNGRLDVCYNPEKYGLCHKVEWSEEDERLLNIIIDILDIEEHNGHLTLGDLKACVKLLKSLHPIWKPSDEQLRPLEYAIDYFKKKGNDTTYLESLLNDLNEL